MEDGEQAKKEEAEEKVISYLSALALRLWNILAVKLLRREWFFFSAAASFASPPVSSSRYSSFL